MDGRNSLQNSLSPKMDWVSFGKLLFNSAKEKNMLPLNYKPSPSNGTVIISEIKQLNGDLMFTSFAVQKCDG